MKALTNSVEQYLFKQPKQVYVVPLTTNNFKLLYMVYLFQISIMASLHSFSFFTLLHTMSV